MSNHHIGNRKSRKSDFREPYLGYYLIFTDTKETEKNYFEGLRNSLPENIKNNLVIKVIETNTYKLVEKAVEEATKQSKYMKIWIVLDRDQVTDFDSIIRNALKHEINTGWSNPCFEIWMNAYFGEMPFYQNSVKCCDGFSNNYEKMVGKKYMKNCKSIYSDLVRYGNESNAIKIAEAKTNELFKLNGVPSKMNPSTTVYKLVCEIIKNR